MNINIKYLVFICSLCILIPDTSFGSPGVAAVGDTVSHSSPLLSSGPQEWRGISDQEELVSFIVSEDGDSILNFTFEVWGARTILVPYSHWEGNRLIVTYEPTTYYGTVSGIISQMDIINKKFNGAYSKGSDRASISGTLTSEDKAEGYLSCTTEESSGLGGTVSVSGSATWKAYPYLPGVSKIAISTDSVDFGSVPVDHSSTETFTIENIGSTDLILYSITSDNDLFTVSPTADTIAPYHSDTVTVTFEPTAIGNFSATVSVANNDPAAGIKTIRVEGEGRTIVAGDLEFKYTTGDAASSIPAIGSDGTIYVGSGDNYLYALNPEGTRKWRYQTGGDVTSSPAIGSDGTIYVGSDDNYLYALNPDGTRKWRNQTGGDVGSSPAIGSDGTIYVGSDDDYLYAINPDGTLKWRYQTGGYVGSSPAIGSDGTIYVGS